jgi:hypothetical protein
MDVLLEQERRAGVAQIVERDPLLPQAGPVQQRLKGPLPEVRGVDEAPALAGEDEA